MEVLRIKTFLDRIREAKKVPLHRQVAATMGIILFGFLLGVLQKWMDSVSGDLPSILLHADLVNFFGRLAIWILLATIISVFSESPVRASVNTFFFLISMVAGYYLYCSFVLGFLPRTYMTAWVAVAFASIFPAYICWYAKGKGVTSVIISGTIIGVLLAQAFSLSFQDGFYMYHLPEVFTWLIGLILLKRKAGEYAAEIGLSLIVAVVYQLVLPHWG